MFELVLAAFRGCSVWRCAAAAESARATTSSSSLSDHSKASVRPSLSDAAGGGIEVFGLEWEGVGFGGVMKAEDLLTCRGVDGSVRELLSTADASLAFASSSQRKKSQPGLF